MGRTQSDGPEDFAAVHSVQDQYRITPMEAWGTDPGTLLAAPVVGSMDDVTPPLEQVNALCSVEFFTLFAELLKENPPHANDYPILHRMRAIGIVPGEDFDPASLDDAATAAVSAARDTALQDLVKAMTEASIGIVRNGWNWEQAFGTYGTSYRVRALVAMAGLGANLPEDAIYPNAFVDADGEPFTGANNYVLHFENGQQPRVDAFWSLTMYDGDGFQVPNPIGRFVIRDRDPLSFNTDGSLDIYIQHTSPGAEHEANWLPAPEGAFAPMLRLYSPTAETLAGDFIPPKIAKN
jgi:hypothetical protein